MANNRWRVLFFAPLVGCYVAKAHPAPANTESIVFADSVKIAFYEEAPHAYRKL
jgi:hypothetical protein